MVIGDSNKAIATSESAVPISPDRPLKHRASGWAMTCSRVEGIPV